MEECLSSQRAFKSHYSKNPIVSKIIIALIISLFLGGLVAHSAATSAAEVAAQTASHSGWTGFVNHFTSWPLIGGYAEAYVHDVTTEAASEARSKAAIGALPRSIAITFVVFGVLFLLMWKITKCFQKGSSLDALANVVGEFIFLPMLARYNEVISQNPNAEGFAYNSAIEKICEWGYKKEYAENLVNQYLFQFPASDLKQLFIREVAHIESLGKRDLYQGVCYKSEVPPEDIQKLALKLANEVLPETKKKRLRS
ncbi:MAG: hypothetical protein J6T96_15540 [Bacteroidales bacterium]|nr:hypothetical protein [Bacteroidales bacterium]